MATVVALGGFIIPALMDNGYPQKYTLGLMTTSPNLGVIIPPSIGMILYSMISNVSLEGLFLTGFLPGILIMFGVCVYALNVELFIYKTVKFRDVKKNTVSSAVTSATLLIIVAGATCFGRLLTLENIPGKITEAVLAAILEDAF